MTTTIRLPNDLHRKLVKEAKKQGVTMNAYIVFALKEKLENRIKIKA